MTLNTIIEEEKKEFERNFTFTAPANEGAYFYKVRADATPENIKSFLTTAMQRAYEAGLHSQQERLMSEVLDRRDTLEKAYQKAKGEPVTEQILEFALVQVDAVIEKIKQ